MRVFLAGATGVVGWLLVPLLVASRHRVPAVGRTAAKRATLERLGAAPVAVDLFDAAAVRTAVAHHDVVINIATHIPRSSLRMMLPGAWRENDRIRREASRLLAEAARAEGHDEVPAHEGVRELLLLVRRQGGDGLLLQGRDGLERSGVDDHAAGDPGHGRMRRIVHRDALDARARGHVPQRVAAGAAAPDDGGADPLLAGPQPPGLRHGARIRR